METRHRIQNTNMDLKMSTLSFLTTSFELGHMHSIPVVGLMKVLSWFWLFFANDVYLEFITALTDKVFLFIVGIKIMFQPGSVLNKNGMSQTGTILQETDHADKWLKIQINWINLVHNTEYDLYIDIKSDIYWGITVMQLFHA